MSSRVLPSLPVLMTPTLSLLAALPLAGAFAMTESATFEPVAREEIGHRCPPLREREGGAAYRNCVTDGMTAQTGVTAPPSADALPADAAPGGVSLDALPFDDRHAIQQACTDVGELVADERCVAAELASLEGVPEPFLGALDDDERHALRRQCSEVQRRDGVASYRRCLDDALAAVEALPAPDLAALTLLERNALERRCNAADATAADYRRCLLEALGPSTDIARPGEPADASADEATGGGIESERSEETNVRRVTVPGIELDGEGAAAADAADLALAAATPEASATSSGAETDGGAGANGSDDVTPPDPEPRAGDPLARLSATVADLDGTERIVLGAALALPLLLLGLWAAMRRARSRPAEAWSDALGREPDFDATDELPAHLRPDDLHGTGGAADAAWDDDFTPPLARPTSGAVAASPTDPFDAPPSASPRGSRGDARAGSPVDSRSAAADPPSSEPPAESGQTARPAASAATPRSAFVPRSPFGRWLLAAPLPHRRQHAIEYLIYWMAYGDERYEPETRTALLRDGGDDGDPHDLIKRRVLEQDTLAFADVLRWLQSWTGMRERVQIIDLLMVLLINEGAMTPSQNTLLHFLADVFGLGADTLDERHEEAFGTPMPALARVDLAAWWERLEPPHASRWDPRTVAALDEETRCRIRLGLPLAGEVSEEAVADGFRRAARRCHPHRFDALGEREQTLAERQFGKFEEARNRLMGVQS